MYKPSQLGCFIISLVSYTERIKKIERQPDSNPVDKYNLFGLQKAYEIILNFYYRWPLCIHTEGRGNHFK